MASFTVATPAFTLLAQAGATDAFSQFLPLILMFAVIYLIVLRPMNKQEKDRRKRVESLQKGADVIIGGGIFGKIVNMDDPKVAVVEIADRVRIRVLKRDIVDSQEGALKEADRGRAAVKKPAKATAEKSNESPAKNG